MSEYDPTHPKESDRRKRQPWYVTYLPVIAFTLTLLGASVTFYTRMTLVVERVSNLEIADAALFETRLSEREINLQFQIRDGLIESIRETVRVNESRTNEQFNNIDAKLDKIAEQLHALARASVSRCAPSRT